MKCKRIIVSAIILLSFVLVNMINVGNVPQVKAVTETTTRVIYTDADDGTTDQFGADYETARNDTVGVVWDDATFITIGQTNIWPVYYVYRTFFFFDTSVIPTDANVTEVIFSFYLKTDYSTTDFNFTVVNGQPTYPHKPIEAGDYHLTHYSGDGGQFNSSSLIAGYNNMSLNSNGRSWINTNGTTKLTLRSQNDIDNITPTTEERFTIKSAETGVSYTPKLYITYQTYGAYLFRLYGAYDEMGYRDGAINVTFYRPTQQWLNFTLNGTYNVTSEADTRMVFQFDLGYNQSRVYYVKDDYEDIYVFKPSEPYYTYYFTIVDLVGVTNGYLESILNINGTDRIVERWRLDVMNNIPFVMSWGRAYTIRLTCDQGTYVWGMFVASAETSQTLTITPAMFPTTYPGLNVTANALRKNATWIQVNYTDNEALTSWVQITIQYKSGFSWSTAYTQNNTGNTHQLDWYSADEDVDYLAKVTALQNGTTQTWTFSLPKPALSTNPWDVLDSLGNWPFPAKNLIGLFIILAVFGVFSYWRMPLGCVLGVITAGFLTLIGWLDLNWNLIALAGSVAVFAGIAKAKREEREI